MKNMLKSLVRHEKITTTVAKAKELRRYAEHFVTLGKQGDLNSRRNAFAWLRDNELLAKLFSEYATRFADRQGGYTRMTLLGPRLGDQAEMAIIEYLPGKQTAASADKGSSKTTKKAKAKKSAAKSDAPKKAKAAKSKA
jgi:large subunit ribosomal protein L17